MSAAAARRLSSLTQRQWRLQSSRQLIRVAPRVTVSRRAPQAPLTEQSRWASTSPPLDKSAQTPDEKADPALENADSEKAPEVLSEGAAQDPELYILSIVILFAFGVAGFYFGRKPTSGTSEANVAIADGTMPWEVEGAEDSKDRFKYKYHPGGDKSKPLKNAPSALNVVIIPDVNLPKELHDRFNKWGKDEYDV